jgi:hypothetical protein
MCKSVTNDRENIVLAAVNHSVELSFLNCVRNFILQQSRTDFTYMLLGHPFIKHTKYVRNINI